MKNEIPKIVAEAAVRLTPEQQFAMSSVIESWRERKGLVVASLAEPDDIYITFRLLPTEIGEKIIKIVEDYYAE